MDADDQAAELEVRAFRAGSRQIVLAVAANVLLAALMLGVPYWRGHVQGKRALTAFSRFAGCVFGAEPKTGLGLSLPPGERAHFAGQVMRAAGGWPGRCKPALQSIAPEEAIFLWPSVKQAGADVRAAVRLVGRELEQLARQRARNPEGRVPERPLLAVDRLRAALALLAKAADADEGIDGNAIAFRKPAAVAEPARLPIVAGSHAALQVWVGLDGLYALAMDGRGVSWLRVEGGKLEHRRFKRTSLVRAALRAGAQPLIVWAMSPKRCEQEEHHCVHRATGVARFAQDAEALPTPSWLAGHPAGRADRSLRLSVAGQVDLLARANAEGALELRRFALPAEARPDAPPSAPLQRFPLPDAQAPRDALLLPGVPGAVAYIVDGEQGVQAFVWDYERGQAPVALGTLAGEGGWLVACQGEDGRYLAYGSARELGVARLPAEGAPRVVQPPLPIALGDPLDAEDEGHDRVRLLCAGARATLVGASARRALLSLSCGQSGCERGPELARGVASFDAAALADGTLLAYSRTREPQLSVLSLDAHGAPRGPARVPGACWDPKSGMCDQPTLVADAGRLLLCARDGSDLLALESDDAGQHWKTMAGLKVSTAIDSDESAPLRQHRVRKGLD